MDLFVIFCVSIFLFGLELVYFKIAERFNIIDKPNHRSSHTTVTIRGGGVIFFLSAVIGSIYLGFDYKFFIIGLILISLISFADDIKPISSLARITVHLLAVSLLFYELGMFQKPVLMILLGLFFVIGSINAINFMDGINGITGSYGIVALSTLYYINEHIVSFTDGRYLIFPLLSLIIFGFFNFRTKAKCFAGDVGSVSLAFIILFFLFQLIIKTNNLGYVLLLLMYGLDTAITLFLRYIRKEKLSEAHRSHFYQYLANGKGYSHLSVSALYCVLQIAINVALMLLIPLSTLYSVLILVIGVLIYFFTRLRLEGPRALFGR